MKTHTQIKARIAEIHGSYTRVLKNRIVTIRAEPKVLLQIYAEAQLRALYWVLGTMQKSSLKIKQ